MTNVPKIMLSACTPFVILVCFATFGYAAESDGDVEVLVPGTSLIDEEHTAPDLVPPRPDAAPSEAATAETQARDDRAAEESRENDDKAALVPPSGQRQQSASELVTISEEHDLIDFPVLDSVECEAIFGDEADDAHSERLKKQKLAGVRGLKGYYAITHRARRWKQPIPLNLRGVAVSGVVEDDEGQSYLLVNLDENVAQEYACNAGYYALDSDDSIYGQAYIIAIADDFVLFEADGRLAYVPADEQADPHFRMIWQSPWMIAHDQAASVGSSSSTRSRRTKRSRNYRRKNRRRR